MLLTGCGMAENWRNVRGGPNMSVTVDINWVKFWTKNGETHDIMGVGGGQKLAETHLRGATVVFSQFMSKT